MAYDFSEWVGSWENFELYFDDPHPAMRQAWQEAEQAIRTRKKDPVSAILYRNGAKRFWQDACYTKTDANPYRLGGWRVAADGDDALAVEWLAEDGASLGLWHYRLDTVIQKGLEGKVNYLFCASDATPDCPFGCFLTMAPMPARAEKESGGLIAHLHFQFAAKKEDLLKPGDRLRHPHWYATLCDAEATMLQRCNIVRALHKLDVWDALPTN